MRDSRPVVTPGCDPAANGGRNPATPRPRPLPRTAGDRLPSPLATVELRDRPPWLRGIVLALPGIIFEYEATGERLRLLADGTLEPVLPGGYPRPGCAHATAREP